MVPCFVATFCYVFDFYCALPWAVMSLERQLISFKNRFLIRYLSAGVKIGEQDPELDGPWPDPEDSSCVLPFLPALGKKTFRLCVAGSRYRRFPL